MAGSASGLDTSDMPSASPDSDPVGVESPPLTESAALSVAAVARRLGVAPATLRTWDRRYGLGPSEHAAGAHRRYGPADLARLEVMRRLTRQGVGPAEAARVALAEVDGSPHAQPQWITSAAAAPAASAAVRGLARAAMALDVPAATEIITQTLAVRGVTWTWEQLVVPVLVGVGKRWELTGEGVEVEHVLSECVAGVFRSSFAAAGPGRNPRPVLLASAEEEDHSLPLHALAAALAERQVATRMLGPRLPSAALADAVRRSGPCAVFVWSQLPATGSTAQLDALPVQRPASLLVAGGPGWHGVLPPGAVQAHDLTDAVVRIVSASGA